MRVIAPIPFGVPGKLGDEQNLIRRENLEIHHPRFYYTPKILRSAYAGFYLWSIRKALRRVLADFQPQAVIGYWAYPDGAAAVRVARKLGVPSAILVGGSDVLVLAADEARRPQIARALQNADAVVAVSNHLRDKVLELGVEAAKAFVRPQGVDREVFHAGDKKQARQKLGIAGNKPVLLWVGRIVQVKALEVLLEACHLLRQMGVAFDLYLVGEGPLRGAMEQICDTFVLWDCVHFVGAQRQDVLADWYHAADLTVLCSRSEGIPNVLRESLACGCPFVATAVGGIPEWCGDPGRLVLPDDAGQLAQAIAAALRAPPPLPEVPLPDWDQSAQILLDILQKVAGGTP